MRIRINLIGCDGTTHWEQDITDEQLEFLKQIEKKSKELSPYSCYPILQAYSVCEHCNQTHSPEWYTDGDCLDDGPYTMDEMESKE